MARPKDRKVDAPESLSDEDIGGVTGGVMSTQQSTSGWVVDDSDDGGAWLMGGSADGSVVDTGIDEDHRAPTTRVKRR